MAKKKSYPTKHFLIIAVAIVVVSGLIYSYFSTRHVTKLKALDRPIIVDHTSVDLFDEIPPEYIDAARNIRMVFSDRSVGQNINESLDCLTAETWATSPSSCRRDYYDTTNWLARNYNQSDFNNGLVPLEIQFTPDPVKYNRSNWTFVAKGGSWSDLTKDFIQTLAPSYINSKDVLTYQFSYLNVTENDDIANPDRGFFSDNTSKYDIHDLESYIAQHPDKIFIFWTSSLARSIGTRPSTEFNQQMRDYARANNKVLFDMADIISHTDQGVECYDNRDGVQYCSGTNCENYPDDGVSYPAICQNYTSEKDGGHLGSVSGARIRMAKAFWVLMAQIAGWDPGGTSTPPTDPVNHAPAVSDSTYETYVNTSVDTDINYSDPDGPGPYTTRVTVLPQHGSVTGSGQNYTYTPADGFIGTDSFTVEVSDSELSSSAIITVRVLDNTQPTSSAAFYWSFDTDSAKPDVGDCPDCSNSGATWITSGHDNGAYDFTGSTSKLDFGKLVFGESQQFTVNAWIKPHFDETDTSWHTVFGQQGVFSLFYLADIRDFRFNLRTSNGNNFRVDTKDLAWDPDTWHHVMVTYNGSQIKLYWDGVEKASSNATGSLFAGTGKFQVGISEVGTNPFNGVIDEMEIYNVALEPSQVLGVSTTNHENETIFQKILRAVGL